jgi:D-alanyl-lipoteichoic acid acyltransferase DltB (MBOAT superfamily)
VFTPLSINFRDYDKLGLIFAIVINFTICGIWHGANWTYVLFGFLHGCYFIPLILNGTMNKKKKIAKGKWLPSLTEFKNMVLTFTLVMLTFIVFRADTIQQAFHYVSGIASLSLFATPKFYGMVKAITTLGLIGIFVVTEWNGREEQYAIAAVGMKWSRPIKWVFYSCIIFLIGMYMQTEETPFIYVQF